MKTSASQFELIVSFLESLSMYESFLEIAFEAELDTSEGPELLEAARELCAENPSTRPAAIAMLRDMIHERGECFPPRTDDAYLLRFLRARSFVPARAHRLLVHNCTFREQNTALYKGVDLWSLAKVKDAYDGNFQDRPEYGRITILNFGTWDPSEFPVVDLVRAGVVQCEIGLRQPKMQVLGGTVIVDLAGISLRHVATLTPTVAYQIVCLMGVAYPTRVRSCHIINYSWLFNSFFYIFKRFIPRKAWSSIFFHGNDLKSLQSHINKECLPPRYGGTCRNSSSFGVWLKKIKKYRDEKFDQEMKSLGYIIKE